MFTKHKPKNTKLSPLLNDKLNVYQSSHTNHKSRNEKKHMVTSVPSIISADVQITGDIISSGEIQFDGFINGNIKAKKIIITENAIINGDIDASDVEVRGEVNGVIIVETILLSSTAKVIGDVTYVTMNIERGAQFEGHSAIADYHNKNITDVSSVLKNDKSDNKNNKTVEILKA